MKISALRSGLPIFSCYVTVDEKACDIREESDVGKV